MCCFLACLLIAVDHVTEIRLHLQFYDIMEGQQPDLRLLRRIASDFRAGGEIASVAFGIN